MNILFLIDSLGSGGAQRQIVTIAVLLKAKGYYVEFLVYSDGDFFKSRLDENNITIKKIYTSNFISRIVKVRKHIRRGNYDVVISFMDVPNFINNFSAVGFHNWKVITSERSSKLETFTTRKNRLFNWFQRYSDAIVCNSENAKNMWVSFYPKYKDKLKVIYNTVELTKINSTYTPLKNGKLHLVVAASYQGLKNPINLIKAVKLLSEADKNRLKIDWFGRKNTDPIFKTKIYDEARLLVTKYELENIISLNSEISEIQDKMNSADFVGLFSTLEGLPNVICEAMSIGKPILMTKVSDYYNFIDSNNGVICESTSPKDISLALEKALNNSNKLNSMGMSSLKKSNLLFNSDKVVSEWLMIINN